MGVYQPRRALAVPSSPHASLQARLRGGHSVNAARRHFWLENYGVFAANRVDGNRVKLA